MNPCKGELGKISKTILEKTNDVLVKSIYLNQCKDSNQIISCFRNVKDKSKCVFVHLDITVAYPSITKKVLKDVISFALQHTHLTENELRTIKHCRNSLSYDKNESWKKKNINICFDVIMGSYDGAEICELVGTYILSILSKFIDKNNCGLYCANGRNL